MNVTVSIPLKAQLLTGGFEVHAAPDGTSWSKSQLGEYATKSGVYVLHANGKLLYVGKTTEGDYGNFGERLRRHFQEKASQNSRVHQLLVAQTTPIRAYLLDLEDLDLMIDHGSASVSRERKALIMEQLLIGIYAPEGNAA
jgi:excinuclease UvrABC nuclease subunit